MIHGTAQNLDMKEMKEILRQNVCALMEYHWGKVNINQLQREARCSRGTAQRAVEGTTNLGIDKLFEIARAFSHQGIHPWHLMIEDLNPANPPVIWLSKTEQEFYQKMKSLLEAAKTVK